MSINETVAPTDIERAVKQFKVAQNMGKVASRLESQAAELRNAVADLGLEPLYAPEGQAFNISVVTHEGTLTIKPFNHRRADWGDAYMPSDPEYNALVKRSAYGDDASITVDALEYEPLDSRIWGYDTLRRVRVLVDERVRVPLVETK